MLRENTRPLHSALIYKFLPLTLLTEQKLHSLTVLLETQGLCIPH